jgi:hypothetical protein
MLLHGVCVHAIRELVLPAILGHGTDGFTSPPKEFNNINIKILILLTYNNIISISTLILTLNYYNLITNINVILFIVYVKINITLIAILN